MISILDGPDLKEERVRPTVGFLPSIVVSLYSRLHSNSLRCDCHLAWLSPWLRQRPALGLYTQCSAPPALRGLNLAELRRSDLACSGITSSALRCATTLPIELRPVLCTGGTQL